MTLEILIRCPELAELAQAIQGKNLPAPAAPAPALTVVTPAVTPAPAAPQPPVTTAAPAASQPAVPVAPVAPVAPTYDLNTLARAAADLIDADPNKQPQMVELLGRFQVPTMAALPAERYGEFADALKEMGAKL